MLSLGFNRVRVMILEHFVGKRRGWEGYVGAKLRLEKELRQAGDE